MDLRLELVSVPVADVDRAKAFYVDQVGFGVEQDVRVDENHRFVELMPPGSPVLDRLDHGLSTPSPAASKESSSTSRTSMRCTSSYAIVMLKCPTSRTTRGAVSASSPTPTATVGQSMVRCIRSRSDGETSQPPPRRRPPYGWMPHPDFPGVRTPSSSTKAPLAMAPAAVDKDGRSWRIGTADDLAWIAGHTIDGLTVTNAIPPRFDAYATFYQPEGADITLHERTVVDILKAHTAEQPWWLGYLDTGAHDVVFNTVPKVTLYWGWRYVLVEAGPEQALTWRTGHMRGGLLGGLPDLFFPADRTWLASALWDDTWTDFGGSAELVDALQRDPIANARQVQPDQDAVPPGVTRE